VHCSKFLPHPRSDEKARIDRNYIAIGATNGKTLPGCWG